MDEILIALGRKPSFSQRIWLIILFFSTTSAFSLLLAIGYINDSLLYWKALIIHLIAWAIWFVWQSWLFPLNSIRDMQKDPSSAYKKAFYRDIMPGISMGVALMTHPFSYGLSVNPSLAFDIWWILAGSILIMLAFTLLYAGFKALGSAGASFLYEYQRNNRSFVRHGVYANIRHPLFLGGVIGSFGISLLFHDLWTLILAISTVATLPIYMLIEDSRLTKMYGDEYRIYRASVGAFVPKKFSLKFPFRK